MVSFITAIVVLCIMCGVAGYVAWLVPEDARITWGEAMLAGVWGFAILLLMFGVVPDQWIRWADAMEWNTDNYFYAHGTHDVLGNVIRFDITMQAVRDVIVVVIHVVFLALLPPAIIKLQKRGPARSFGERTVEAPVSDFGRPLVREG